MLDQDQDVSILKSKVNVTLLDGVGVCMYHFKMCMLNRNIDMNYSRRI